MDGASVVLRGILHKNSTVARFFQHGFNLSSSSNLDLPLIQVSTSTGWSWSRDGERGEVGGGRHALLLWDQGYHFQSHVWKSNTTILHFGFSGKISHVNWRRKRSKGVEGRKGKLLRRRLRTLVPGEFLKSSPWFGRSGWQSSFTNLQLKAFSLFIDSHSQAVELEFHLREAELELLAGGRSRAKRFLLNLNCHFFHLHVVHRLKIVLQNLL